VTPAVLTAILALFAALAWGSGDFTNGLAGRKISPFHTTLIAYAVGLIALVIVIAFRPEAIPSAGDMILGGLAGISGMTGLIFLLRGFRVGRMGIVAPVSAVLAAVMPVIVSIFREGFPGWLKALGFLLALAAIWLLSRPEPVHGRPQGLGLALVAGVGFGGFFTLLDFIQTDSDFWPLISGRVAAITLILIFTLLTRKPVIPAKAPWSLLLLGGLLDIGGNLFYLNAVQTGRLDVAAVLAALYPAVTAFLAWLVTSERMAQVQVVGAAAAVTAIILITL
jgi:drug/metabolite transporter (DMT)-like permease